MQRVDGYYLYQVGAAIHPLAEFHAAWGPLGGPTTLQQIQLPLYIAEASLEPLLSRSVFQLRTSLQSGHILLQAIRSLKAKIEQTEDKTKPLTFSDIYGVTSALTSFEAVLGAELSLCPLYVVTQKAGFDTTVLVDAGVACFPTDVWFKAPEAISDLQQGTKCIAFELFTAAGFHLHRANEAVLRRYWDAVSKGAARPKSRNIGDYLNEMNQKDIGSAKVKAALKDLKDLHRNPLIHPEDSIENADDAIAIMNGIHTVMVHMLREMPAITSLPPAGSVATTTMALPAHSGTPTT
jgi:hypothetical protein